METYNVERQRRGLERIRDRYFRKVIAYQDGHLTHHGDCVIYRSIELEDVPYAYCSCGLFHDFRWIDSNLTDKLYDRVKYHEELGKEVGRKPGDPPVVSDEEMNALWDKLEKQGWKKCVEPTEEEWADICERDWALIGEVFGEAFRDRRKEEWEHLEAMEAHGR